MCCTCRRRYAERVFAKARKLTEQELNITSIIRAQRQVVAFYHALGQEGDQKALQAVKRLIELSDDEPPQESSSPIIAAHDSENQRDQAKKKERDSDQEHSESVVHMQHEKMGLIKAAETS